MIDQLIAALNQEIDLSAEEIADTLWLAMHMGQSGVNSTSHKSPQTQADLETTEDNSNEQTELDLSDKPSTETLTTEAEATEKKQKSDRASVYNQKPDQTQKSLDIPFKVPDAPSLREQLDLARALRPLMRRIPSGSSLVLDEAATTQRIADEGIWLPVIKPTLEPWLDLELVVDEGISMQIWRHTIKELERLLKNYGIFRDVRVWGLINNEQNKIQIRRGIGATAKNQSPRSAAELIDSSGRRLVLVVSDCVSDLWRSGAVNLALQTWANNVPTAIIQMLPQWLWGRTALGRATEVIFQGLALSFSNRQLITNTVSLWSEIDEAKGIKVPVFTLESERVSKWAQMLVGKDSIQSSGFVFKPEVRNLEQDKPLFNLDRGELTAQQSVQAFRVTASPMARKLAGLLASAPVISLPVVRLIRETMLKESQQVHVAEVFLGGLLKPLSEIKVDTDPEYVQYGFIDGVRELLVDSVPTSSVLNVVEEVSKFVAKKVGLSLSEFVATLNNPQEVRNSKFSEEILPFALVTSQVLKRLGGKYIKFGEQLNKSKKYWIFQGNPKNYRLEDAIRDLKEMPWQLKRHKDDIAMGDGAIIWISGKKAGIYAFGEISKPVKIFGKVTDIDYWIDKDIQNNLMTRPGPCIRFTNKLLDKPIRKEQLKQDSLLKNLKVILYPFQGSVFEATSEQWNRIHEFRTLDIELPVAEVEQLSEKEIDYTQLNKLLTDGNWRKADEQTAKIMSKVANRKIKEWINKEDIEKFPCEDLQNINKLWLDYSKGRFGFSVQQEIYQDIEKTIKPNQKIWDIFGERVGWRSGKNWLAYSNLNFQLNAPRGHLPRLLPLGSRPHWRKVRTSWMQRLISCGIRVTTPEKSKNYLEDNLEILIKEIVPYNQEVFVDVINQSLENFLLNETVTSYTIPDDNNEATIYSVNSPKNIDLEVEWNSSSLLCLFSVSFSLIVDCELSYSIFKADYHNIDDNKVSKISISEWNDHYFSAEETYTLQVEGIISVEGDSKILESSLLSHDELLKFLQQTDVSIDTITNIEVIS